MKPSARSAIRNDVLTDYEAPSPDLVLRVVRALPSSPRKPVSRRGRVAFQTLAVVAAAPGIGIPTVGGRGSRRGISLPARSPLRRRRGPPPPAHHPHRARGSHPA